MKLRAIVIAFPFLLAACTSGAETTSTTEEFLKNPLYAERYWDDLVDVLVELEIQNDPILGERGKQSFVDTVRREALAKAKEATALQREGTTGTFVSAEEYARGEVLYHDNVLYMDSLFDTIPGPSLHLYLSTVVDPREGAFPDDSVIDLGVLRSPYGAQQYDVPSTENPLLYRTVALFDRGLDRLFGFAQLNK